ncbi:MAG: inovirus Gp2 family protein [Moraxellaceae bacterium]|nr:inovirus Gp2 family protein [Moraxellaceae bacterium]
MSRRHTCNANLALHSDGLWNGIPVISNHGPLIENYLAAIHQVLLSAIDEYPRVCVMRFDLRIPFDWPATPNTVITRFKRSLMAQIDADLNRRIGLGRRPVPCRLRYVWVREWKDSDHQHYHAAILVNRDAYFTLGNYSFASADSGVGGGASATYGANMAQRIQIAWGRALALSQDAVAGLVHFPRNPVYCIDRNSTRYVDDFEDVFFRLSYFAKAVTKRYGDKTHNFGYSQG